MAKIKGNGNGGTSGEGGAPAEASIGYVKGPDGELASDLVHRPASADLGAADTRSATTADEPADIPPDAQERPATDAPAPIDIKAVQQRFTARLPGLFELREKLRRLEDEHEADGGILAEALIVRAKDAGSSPTIELGGKLWRAKRDAQKRGGRPQLHELVKHAPIEL
jgi:hypothetical protein